MRCPPLENHNNSCACVCYPLQIYRGKERTGRGRDWPTAAIIRRGVHFSQWGALSTQQTKRSVARSPQESQGERLSSTKISRASLFIRVLGSPRSCCWVIHHCKYVCWLKTFLSFGASSAASHCFSWPSCLESSFGVVGVGTAAPPCCRRPVSTAFILIPRTAG